MNCWDLLLICAVNPRHERAVCHACWMNVSITLFEKCVAIYPIMTKQLTFTLWHSVFHLLGKMSTFVEAPTKSDTFLVVCRPCYQLVWSFHQLSKHGIRTANTALGNFKTWRNLLAIVTGSWFLQVVFYLYFNNWKISRNFLPIFWITYKCFLTILIIS